MDQKPDSNIPDINGMYPDPVERSHNMFKEQKKAHASESLKNCLFLFVVLLVILGIGWYLNQKGIITLTKNSVSNQINDEVLKKDLARVKTVSGYYYKGDKTFVGFDSDTDLRQVASSLKNNGADLYIQGLSETTFVAYIILPSSKEYYCTDAKGYLGKIDVIEPSQTTCQ